MARQLRSLGVEFDEIDVDSDPQLRLQYGREVPVLVDWRDQTLCRHRLDAETIKKLR